MNKAELIKQIKQLRADKAPQAEIDAVQAEIDALDAVDFKEKETGSFKESAFKKDSKPKSKKGKPKFDKAHDRSGKEQGKGKPANGSAAFTSAFTGSDLSNPAFEVATSGDIAYVGGSRVTFTGQTVEDFLLSQGPSIVRDSRGRDEQRSLNIGALSSIKMVKLIDPVVKPKVDETYGSAIVYENTQAMAKTMGMKEIDFTSNKPIATGETADTGIAEVNLPTNMRFNTPTFPQVKGEVYLMPLKGYIPTKVATKDMQLIENAYAGNIKTISREKPIDKTLKTITSADQVHAWIRKGGTKLDVIKFDVVDPADLVDDSFRSKREVAHKIATINTIRKFRDTYNQKADSPFTRVNNPLEIINAIEFGTDMKTFAYMLRDAIFSAINFAPVKKAKVGYNSPNIYHFHEGALASAGAFGNPMLKLDKWVNSLPGVVNKSVVERFRSMGRASLTNKRHAFHALNPMIERYVAPTFNFEVSDTAGALTTARKIEEMTHPVQSHIATAEMYMPHGNMLQDFIIKFKEVLLDKKARALRTGVDANDSANQWMLISKTEMTGFMFNFIKNIDNIIQWTNEVINQVDEFYDVMKKDKIVDESFYAWSMAQDPFGPKFDPQRPTDLRNKLETKLEFVLPVYMSSVHKIQPIRFNGGSVDTPKASTMLMGPIAIQQNNTDVKKSTTLGKVVGYSYTNIQFFVNPHFIPYKLENILYDLAVPIVGKERTHNNYFPVPTMKNFDNQITVKELYETFMFLDSSFIPAPFVQTTGFDGLQLGTEDDGAKIDFQGGAVSNYEQPYMTWYENTSYAKSLTFEISRENSYEAYADLKSVRTTYAGGDLVKIGVPLSQSTFNNEMNKGSLAVYSNKLLELLGIPYFDAIDAKNNQDSFDAVSLYLLKFQQSADVDLWSYINEYIQKGELSNVADETLVSIQVPALKSDSLGK